MSSTVILDGLRTLRRLIRDAAMEAFQPPPVMTVSQWSDDFRLLPVTSAEPGPFRTDRLPYMRRIQDVLGDDTTREVVFAKSAQIAGSTVGENWLGFAIDQDPSGIICVWPTEKKLQTWSLTRLDPLLQDSPCLARKFPKTGRRDAGDSMAKKIFAGGFLLAITAKSTSDLKSTSARRAIAEELDEWEVDLKNQGDPLELLRVRQRTYWNSKLFIVSTPTTVEASRIWDELKQSSWEEYWVACPHCHEHQTLRWRDGDENPDEAGDYRLIWEKDAEGFLIPGTTRYVCVNGCVIEERWKSWMLEDTREKHGAQWRARNPGRSVVGFHINTIYSPLCAWDDIVLAFQRAKGNDGKLKTFVNTFLGLPYQGKGETISSHFLSQRAETYPTAGSGEQEVEVIPKGVGVLTAGVDVQGDRLELFVWGWGAESERWLIKWEQINGDPGKVDVWRELEKERIKLRRHESGNVLSIAAMCVDAGYQTDMVHAFCDAHGSADRVIAVVGRSGPGKKLLTPPDKQKFKRPGKRPTHVVGTDSGKSLVSSSLRVKEPGPSYVHFPTSTDSVLYEQLTSEKLVTKYVRGFPVRSWTLIAGRRNEALDGAVYAEAALMQIDPAIRSKLAHVVQTVNDIGATMAANAPQQASPASGRRMLSKGLPR